MRVRKQDENGDYVFGHGSSDFWYNQPEGVAQKLKTRLGLFTGEWFLDTSEGTPWGGFPLNDIVVSQGKVLGAHTELSRDVAIKRRILDTDGVVNISSYSSIFVPDTRSFNVTLTVNTIYGGLLVVGSGILGSQFTLGVSPLDSGVPLG